jgi:RNA polymerase sigma-70 factor (ECF subfamily)
MDTTINTAEPGRAVQTARAHRLAAAIDRDKALTALMRSAQGGNEGAYERLLRELAPLIGRMIRRQVAFLSPSDREDLLQDVLLSMHAARKSYDPARPFVPWLRAIAVNRAIDFMRRQSRRGTGQVLTDDIAAAIADDHAGDAVTRYDALDALRRAISMLPQGQRSAIELLKLREMTLVEAAAMTGMSISALKASVHRAVGNLRVSLALDHAA